MTSDSSRCVAQTKAGQRCSWPARFSDGCCHLHSVTPEGQATRQAVSIMGAESNRKPPQLVTLDDAIRYAAWAANQFARGRLTEKQLAAVDKLLDRFAALVKARDQDGKFAEMQKALAELKAGKAKA